MKYKAILSILAIMVLLSVSVMAQQTGYGKQAVNSQVQGLEKGYVVAESDEQVQKMEQTMEKVQNQHRNRLNEMNKLQFQESKKEGEVIATCKGEARFLGMIKMQHSYRYEINNEGELTRNKYWHDFLWREIGSDVLEEEAE